MIKYNPVVLIVFFICLIIRIGAGHVAAQDIVTTIDLSSDLNSSSFTPDIGINRKTNKIYIATRNEVNKTKIVVIDGKNNNIIDSITIGIGFIPFAIAVNSITDRIYVSDLNSNNLHIISGTRNKVIKTIEINDGIGGIDIDHVANRIYVVNLRRVTVTVLDGETNDVIDIIELQQDTDQFFFTGGIKVNHVTNRIYVLNNYTTKDLSGNRRGGSGLPIEPLSRPDLYSSHVNHNKTITILDRLTNRIIDTVHLGNDIITGLIGRRAGLPPLYSNYRDSIASVNDIGLNPLTNRIYISVDIFSMDGLLPSSTTFSSILVMDGFTNKIIESIDIGGKVANGDLFSIIGINPKTNRIYLNNRAGNSVSVIDGFTNQVISTLEVGEPPQAIEVNSANNSLYVISFFTGNVNVIQDDGLVTTSPTLTVEPSSATITPSPGDAIVTLLDNNGKPLSGIAVKSSARGIGATVFPPLVITDKDGVAKFKFRFNSVPIRKDNKISFNANGLEAAIILEN